MKVSVNCAFGEMVSIKEIKPHPKNPNRHPEKQIVMLAELIKHHGWRSPITVSKLSGFVVRGHGRLEAAKMLGLSKVPVDFQDYSNELSEIADLIADNRVQDYSELDVEEVNQILAEFNDADFLVEWAGFNLDELDFSDSADDNDNNEDSNLDDVTNRSDKSLTKVIVLVSDSMRETLFSTLRELSSKMSSDDLRWKI